MIVQSALAKPRIQSPASSRSATPAAAAQPLDSFSPLSARLAIESKRAIAGDNSWGDVAAQLARIRALDAGKPRRKITILGAGMAGLAAAYELEKLGHQVSVFEADARFGGRLLTHRFADGTYHELGGMRIYDCHDYSHHYVDELGLKLRPFLSSNEAGLGFEDIHGTVTRSKDAKERLFPQFELTEEEKALPSPSALLDKYVGELIESLTPEEKRSLFSTKLATDRLRELDQLSMREYLEQRTGQSSIDLIVSASGVGSQIDLGVLGYLRDELRLASAEKAEEIEGGIDHLPRGLAERLQAPIELNTQVLGMRVRDDGKVELELSRAGGEPVTEVHDEVLCTLPFSVLRTLQLEGLSDRKLSAICEMSYSPASKAVLHVKRRFWESDYGIYGGASLTDRGTGRTYYPSTNAEAKDPAVSAAPSALLASYVEGDEAQELGAKPPQEQLRTVIENVARFHPEIAEPGMVDDFAVMSWAHHPFARGAYLVATPGSNHLYGKAVPPVGNLHFAGEHVSHDNGWIQGALISSLRAVEELVAAPGARTADR